MKTQFINDKRTWFWALALIDAISLIAANTAAARLISLPFGLTAIAGIIIIPVSYIIADIMAEIYGFRNSMIESVIAFAGNWVFYGIIMLSLALPYGGGLPTSAMQAVFSLGWRAIVASIVSYFAGVAVNNLIMDSLHKHDGENHLFKRVMLSTVAGEIVDKILFTTITFAFLIPWHAITTTILTMSALAIAYEFFAYFIGSKWAIRALRKLGD